MKKFINICDWDIYFYHAEDCAEGLQRCKSMHIPAKILAQAEENIKLKNAGSTLTNVSQKRICVLIAEQTSKAELLNTLSHEIRHIVDIITDGNGECSPANITGEITSYFADWV